MVGPEARPRPFDVEARRFAHPVAQAGDHGRHELGANGGCVLADVERAADGHAPVEQLRPQWVDGAAEVHRCRPGEHHVALHQVGREPELEPVHVRRPARGEDDSAGDDGAGARLDPADRVPLDLDGRHRHAGRHVVEPGGQA
jgi:hypothetical protein